MNICPTPISYKEMHALSMQVIKYTVSKFSALTESQSKFIIDTISRTGVNRIETKSLSVDRKIIQKVFDLYAEEFAELASKRGLKVHIMPLSLGTENESLDIDIMRDGLIELPTKLRSSACKIARIMDRADIENRPFCLPPKLAQINRKKQVIEFIDRLYSLTEETDDILLYQEEKAVCSPSLVAQKLTENPMSQQMYENLMFGVD